MDRWSCFILALVGFFWMVGLIFATLLLQEKILIVQGTAFNWPKPDHFRVVFLSREDELRNAIGRIKHFFSTYSQ